ncbi:EAL domain-containing protein [Gloeothece verrucosa]|uniref:Diguanylate cyclase/phosphodiesterase with PAS/PAC sensor(S) n=1 Tax=Gloeothece verrucosa (strain PCC 7822) TaxID=497965 RepID=E0U7K8_GLOV7|nr:EAL domain-containing protein [Gloeothece verrucosa]ADN13704.1 diguanylate cyclase/phosphodiesterase with PAS/PAC sensor(s) [Gloeothece verrucosa PCC 7822]
MKTIIKIVYLGFFSLLLASQLFCLKGVAQDTDQVSLLEVTAVIPKYFPPLYLVDRTGKPSGFAIDVMKEVAKLAQLKVRYEIKNTWSEVQETLINGNADLIPNLGITPARQTQMSFTAPVETDSVSVFVRASNHQIKTVAHLAGHRVGVVKGTVGYEIAKNRQNIQLEVFDGIEYGVFELLAGHVDALIYSESVLKEIVAQADVSNRIKILGEPLAEIKRAIALRKDNLLLLTRLDKAVNSFVGSPKYEQIYRKWYGEPENFWTVGRLFWLMSGLLITTILLMSLWRYISLRPFYRLQQIEAALRASESRYRGIVEDQSEFICRYRPGGTLTFVNQAYCRYFQKTPAAVLDNTFWDLIYSEDQPQVAQNIASLTPENPMITHEHRVRLSSGEIRWNQWTNRVIMDEKRNIIEFQAVGRDITQLKQVEAALRQLNEELEQRVEQRTAELAAEIRERQEIETALIKSQAKYEQLVEKLSKSEERLQLALEGSGDTIWEWNLGTGELYCDPNWIRRLGYDPREEAINIEWWRSKIDPETLSDHEAALENYLNGKTEYLALEYKIQTLEGEWLWIGGRGKCIAYDQQRKPLKILGTHRDITETKQTQENLRQQQELLKTIVEQIPVMLAYFDQHYNLLWVNREWEKIWGWSLENRQKGDLLAEFEPESEYRQSVLNYIKSAQGKWRDFKILVRDGRIIDTSWANVKLSDGTSIAIGQDITERKRIEEILRESEEKYRLFFDANPNPLWVYDLETFAFLEVNQATIEHYGYTREEFLAMTIRDIRPPEDVPLLEQYILQINPHFNRSGQWRHRKANGEIIDVEITSHGLEYAGRKARLVLAHDITERLKAEKALQESKERFHRAIVDAPLPILIHAEDGEIVQVNHAWTELSGYHLDELSTIADWTEKAYGERKDIVRSVIDQLYEIDGKVEEGEFAITIKSGETRIWDFSSAPLGKLADGRRLIISMAIDITERKQAEEQLRHSVLHDGLTGLPNRTLLLDRVEQAIKRKQQQPNYLFAILFIDLDRFKVVNDSLGHLVGDQLLKTIADKLQRCVRPTDTVARFGGDEFVILLEDLTIWTDATKMAQRITEEFESSFTLQEQEYFTSASIGITFCSSPEQTPSELVRNADIAMYRSKEAGRARYTMFDPIMHTQATQLLELETNLRLALEREEFIVYYQPIVSLMNRNLLGFEALVRWIHPEKGVISPANFIPVAEETGLIIPLGEWVLRESCRQMKAWQEQFIGAENLRVSVNLSGKQLQQPNLINRIDNILTETGLEGKNLKLEITESMLMNNKEQVSELLLQMKAKKIQVSIDDFGTGYSSLSYLHYLPVDTLKIDRSFVSRMSQVGENFEIVEAIITLAHHLQMDVVAEGVETEQHLRQLQQLGCEFGQGYFFSKPLESEKIVSWLERL